MYEIKWLKILIVEKYYHNNQESTELIHHKYRIIYLSFSVVSKLMQQGLAGRRFGDLIDIERDIYNDTKSKSNGFNKG